MAIDASILDLLASCLEYPDPDAAARARAAASGLASAEPELSAALFGLAVFLERSEPGEAEERYTALFDMNPVCTLHVGYHVFGDTYPRGEFLAALAAELRHAGVATNGDLPDFLPTVLRLAGRLERDEDRRSLRELALVPALTRMRASLAQSKDPWSRLLRALPEALTE
jgi:nitrate reductase delta subunit